MKKHPYLKLLLPAVLALLAFVPRGNDPIEKLVAALQNWTENNPQEKVYLHTDRPWYSIGDTIWYKAYVTVGPRHQLSAKSGSLYVELVNGADSITKILRLPVMAGMAKGCFPLGNELREGSYRIRSYTQWMRNAGPEYFYDQVFVIKNSPRDSIYTKIDYEYNTVGTQKEATAILTFANRYGKPLVGSEVRYSLRKNYRMLLKGVANTNDKGEVRVVMKNITGDQLKGAHLATTVEAEDFNIVKKTFSMKSIAMQADLQFFAEGGNMLAGLTNRVAFKAVGTDGRGIAVKGEVVENGYHIADFKSSHLGMGSFEFKPMPYHAYMAKVTYADGSTQEVALPPVTDSGYLLSARPDAKGDSVVVTVATAPQEFNGYLPPSHLLVQAGGEVYFTATIPGSTKPSAVSFATKDIPSGMAQITLFADNGTPLNERVFFVQNNDRLEVELKVDKPVYKKREQVSLALNTMGNEDAAAISNFSVSVINEDEVPGNELNEKNIFTHLLLSSDIKGYVEQPNYYFLKPSATTRQHLDLLMLTQGYRRFKWADIVDGKPFDLPYRAEGLATEISGKMVGLWGFKVPYGTAMIVNAKTGLQLKTQADKEGRFSFNNIVFTDGLSFTVGGRRKLLNDARLELVLDKFVAQKQSFNPNLGDMVTDFTLIDTVQLSPAQQEAANQRLKRAKMRKAAMAEAQGRMLRQVNIQGKQKIKVLSTSLSARKGQIVESIIPNEFDAGKKIKHAILDRNIEGLKLFKNQFRHYVISIDKELLTPYINEQVVRGDIFTDMMEWDIEDVTKIDIVRPNNATLPAILIYLRRTYIKDLIDPLHPLTSEYRLKPELTTITPRGFDKVKEFYVPKYDATQQPVYADHRTTVYWNPAVLVKNCSANISFFNGDKPGNYKVVVEGIDADGLLGRQVLRYKVE